MFSIIYLTAPALNGRKEMSHERRYIKSLSTATRLLALRRLLYKVRLSDNLNSNLIYMVLIYLDDASVDKVSSKKWKDNLYLNYNSEKPQFQTKWMTLKRYCLPSKKYVNSDAQSINLELCLEGHENYIDLFDGLDMYVEHNHSIKNKIHHKFIFEKENDERKYIRVKIYLETTRICVGDKYECVESIYDLYNYLKEGASIQVVLTFTKLWNVAGKYGFSIVAERIRINEESLKGGAEEKLEFI